MAEEPLLLGLHTITRSSSGFPDDQNFLVPLWFLLVENIVWQHKAAGELVLTSILRCQKH